jgi:hypothetical protein
MNEERRRQSIGEERKEREREQVTVCAITHILGLRWGR